MTSGISRFVALSVLIHAGALLAWRAPEVPEIRYEGGPPLRLVLVPESVPTPPAGDTPPASRPADSPAGFAPPPTPTTARKERTTPATRPRPDAAAGADDTIRNPGPVAATRATLNAGAAAQGAVPARTAETVTTGSETRVAEAMLSHQELTRRIRAAAATYFYYPPLAQRRGWEGEVRVGLHVAADGRLTGIRLLKSSGYHVLDQAAVRSLKHVANLPEVADRMHNGMDIELPIEYRLVDA